MRFYSFSCHFPAFSCAASPSRPINTDLPLQNSEVALLNKFELLMTNQKLNESFGQNAKVTPSSEHR